MNRAAIFTLAILTVISSLPVVESGTITDNSPSAGLRRYREDFQNLTTGSIPTDSWYNVTTAGTGTQFVNSAKMWQTQDTAAAYAVQLNNNAVGADLCLAGQSLTFTGSVPDLATTTQVEFRVQSGTVASSTSPANSAGIRFTGIVASSVSLVQFFLHDSSGAEIVSGTTGNLNADAAFTTTISQMNCPNLASVLFTNTGLGVATLSMTGDSPFTGTFNEFSLAHTTGAASTTLTADNYDWQGILMPAPTITNISPGGGATPGGNTVTVTGTNFVSGAQVTVDGVATNETFVSATQITFVAPQHAAGATSVIVTNPDGRASNAATYTYAALPTPVINAVVPDIGSTAGGDAVQIQGNNFRDPTVYFDGVAATTVSFYNSRVNVTTPPHAAGIVNVTVTNGDDLQSATLTNGYEYCATTDTDTDGVPDCVDNCPDDFNPSQRDFDADGAGNACQIVSEFGEGVTEDFEDDALGDNSPAQAWYTFSSSHTGTSTAAVVSNGGGNAFRLTGGGGGLALVHFFTNRDMCPATLEWDGRLVSGSSALVNTYIANASGSPAANFVSLNAAESQDRLYAFTQSSGGTAVQFTGMTTNNLLRHYTLRCDDDGTLISANSTATDTAGTYAVSSGALARNAQTAHMPFVTFVIDNGFSLEIDNLTLSFPAGNFSGWQNQTVADITGFDVDQFGQLAITRHDNGETVQVFDGFSLEPGNTDATNCQRFGGVDAMTDSTGESLVAYFDCPTNPLEVQFLQIRDRNMQEPSGQITTITAKDSGSIFDPSGFLAGDQDDDVEISDVGTFPYDFSKQGLDQQFGDDIETENGAFAFSDGSGRIGVVTYQSRNNDVDKSQVASVVIKSGTNPGDPQLCAAYDTTTNPARDLLYGVAPGVNVLGFKVNYGSVNTADGVSVSLTNIFPGSHPETLSANIGCGKDLLVTVSAGNVYLWNIVTGIRTLMHTSPDLGFVGMDPDGLQFAFEDGDEIILMQLNGEIAARFEKPEPVITEVILRNQGNAIYLSGASGIYYLDATPYSQYGNVSYNPFVDIDGDGLATFEDSDIDGDGVPNTSDPDIDGDGAPNTGDVDGDGIPDESDPDIDGDEIPNESDPDIDGDGIPNESDPHPNGSDSDDDGDGLPDNIDGQPGGLGTGTANPGVVPTGGATGQGLFGFSRTVSILGALALILALAFAGYVFTAGRGSRREE